MDKNYDTLSGNPPKSIFAKALPVAKETKQIKSAYCHGLKGDVPTFVSVCPYCNKEHQWGTTGIIPTHHTCSHCATMFKSW